MIYFAQKAVLHIYIFVPTAWLLSLSQHNVITSLRVTTCCCDEAKTSEMVLHFCTFLLNPHFDLEPDYIFRKPTKHRFQRYIVRTEIFPTFHHARVEYISLRTIRDSAHSNECAHTDRQTHKSENSISA